MRALVALLAALTLSGCAFLSRYGLLPSDSGHLPTEPLGCGEVHDPLPRRGDISKPIVGAADYHLHQFANLGFGGRIFWGEAFNPDGMAAALPTCGVNGLCWDDVESVVCDKACRWVLDEKACKAACKDPACSNPPPHGRGGLTEPLSAALRVKIGHAVTGYPSFEGWPMHDSFTHQQIYHRWLRRAFDGGLKLIVNLAVTNEVLCRIWEHDYPCDDMTNVDLQLKAARDLENYIDYQNDCQLNHNGWYRIAESPQQAREIIADGAMAVVLGIEVDSLFNCYSTSAVTTRARCSLDGVKKQINKYRELGVRHLFPIHLFDNAIGGTAAAEDFFNFGNLVTNKDLIKVQNCAPDYSFRYGDITTAASSLIAIASAFYKTSYDLSSEPTYKSTPVQCNQLGLTPFGEKVIAALIENKMILDVDHMSKNARKGLLKIADDYDYPGLVSGHTGFTEVSINNKRHEGQLTPVEVATIIRLGGIFAPELNQGDLEEVGKYSPKTRGEEPHDADQHSGDIVGPRGQRATVEAPVAIEPDCGGSSKGFAQAYFYAVDKLRDHVATLAEDKRSEYVVGVGYGSDFNGLVESPTPRFGRRACDGDRRAEQKNMVEYPIATYEDATIVLDRAVIGSRAFDVNYDGFAHVGMFPDFVADLKAIGMTEEDLKPLFGGAEAYIAMWERVENANTAVLSPPPAGDSQASAAAEPSSPPVQ